MVSMCFLQMLYKQELRGTKITREFTLGYSIEKREHRARFCAIAVGPDSVVVSKWKGRCHTYLHRAYHCLLCFLFPGSGPGPLPPGPSPLRPGPSSEPLLPDRHCLTGPASRSQPPGCSFFPWMRVLFQGGLENEVAPFYVAAPPRAQWPLVFFLLVV